MEFMHIYIYALVSKTSRYYSAVCYYLTMQKTYIEYSKVA